MVVLHGHFNFENAELNVVKKRWFKKRSYCRHFSPRDSFLCTLLNGDIILSTINYPSYIIDRLKGVKIFQVPHHGSDKNWELDVLDGLCGCEMVINYGYGNKFGHPGNQVLTDIYDLRGIWKRRRNTQFKSFTYKVNSIY